MLGAVCLPGTKRERRHAGECQTHSSCRTEKQGPLLTLWIIITVRAEIYVAVDDVSACLHSIVGTRNQGLDEI